MEKYILEKVETPKQAKAFLDLPKRMYKGDPNWITPLDNDINAVFDPKKNIRFRDGEACRWLLRDDKGAVCGRIAAFYTNESAAAEEQPTGGCGFFECIDDQQAADILFDTARDWLKTKGMEAMDGPVNFGDRDSWWGCLVEGFTPPLYANPYNFPYYKELFENYGFLNYFNQYTYDRKLQEGLFSEAVYQKSQKLIDNPSYSFERIGTKKNIRRVAEDFCNIYNKAWAHFPGVKPMPMEHAYELMEKMKPIIDPNLIYFARYEGQPIGFFIMVPDINYGIRSFNGRFGLWHKLIFMYNLKVRKSCNRIFAIIFGVTPEFQGKGVESGIMRAFEKWVTDPASKSHYKQLELAWMGDFNPVMLRMVEQYVCATRLKTHVTYRYLFDRTKEFKRAPKLAVARRPQPQDASGQ